MNSAHLVLGIPLEVSCKILGEWLDLKWLARMDSAFCNHRSRAGVLGILCSKNFCFLHLVDLQEQRMLIWLSSRQLKLRSLHIGAYDGFQLTAYLREHGSSVRRVVCFTVNAIEQVALYCRNLKSLECRGKLTPTTLSAILWFNRELEELQFRDIDALTDSHFEKITLPNVHLLFLGNTNCNDVLIGKILCCIGRLTQVNFAGSKRITDTGIMAVAHHSPQLRAFGADFLQLTDNTLANVTSACSLIQYISCSGNSVVTDSGVRAMVSQLKQLRSLCISNCPLLTSQSLEHIAANSTKTLTVLRMAGFVSVHVNSLVKLLQACTSLHTLSLDCDLNLYHQEIVPHMRSLRSLITYNILSDSVLQSIAQHCTELVQLAIFCTHKYGGAGAQTAQSAHNDTDHPHILLGANQMTTLADPSYTPQGLLALLDGLPFLRLLGIQNTEKHVTEFAELLCARLYPRLVIARKIASFGYEVLEQSIV